jgi:glucose uptake protein GlcU
MATNEVKPTAGAFDIRNIIGALIGVYGVILIVTGIWFTDAQEKAMADGVNLNLRVGIGLLVFGLLFMAWALIRPLRVPAEPVTAPPPHGGP